MYSDHQFNKETQLLTLEQLEERVKALEDAKKESLTTWLVPYIPSMKSLLIALISAGVGATGTYVSTPEKVKEVKGDPPPITIHLPPTHEVKKDDKRPETITVRPAGEDKK